MSEITVRHIKAATDEEIERMSSVLVDAFHGDEFTRWMVGGDMDLVPLIKRAQVRMALIGGELFVAGFGPDDISSVAAWFGPGQEALSSEEQANAGFNEFMERLTPEMKAWWGNYFPAYTGFTTRLLGEGAKKASWHLQLIGTSRHQQRKGLAQALTQAAAELARSSGSALTLETQTPANVTIYQRLGFTLRGNMHVVGPLEMGECELYCLERRP